MPNIFEAVDPRGFKVVCSEERWHDHILTNRSFMKDWEQRVQEVIEKPSIGIYQDARHAERNIYYQIQPGKTRYLKVVVEFENDQGSVITAFPTDSGKAGEKLIWTSPKP